MGMELMVVRPFGPYRVGEQIAADAAKATVLESENAHSVVRVTAHEPERPGAVGGEG